MCSPFLLAATIIHHLNTYRDNQIVSEIVENLYVRMKWDPDQDVIHSSVIVSIKPLASLTDLYRCSSWTLLKRTIAYLFRFLLINRTLIWNTEPLSVSEFREAERYGIGIPSQIVPPAGSVLRAKVVNSKPITYISDAESLKPLTPLDSLCPLAKPMILAEPEIEDYQIAVKSSIVTEYEQSLECLMKFWQNREKHYLPNLRETYKCRNGGQIKHPKIGGIVLIKDEGPKIPAPETKPEQPIPGPRVALDNGPLTKKPDSPIPSRKMYDPGADEEIWIYPADQDEDEQKQSIIPGPALGVPERYCHSSSSVPEPKGRPIILGSASGVPGSSDQYRNKLSVVSTPSLDIIYSVPYSLGRKPQSVPMWISETFDSRDKSARSVGSHTSKLISDKSKELQNIIKTTGKFGTFLDP